MFLDWFVGLGDEGNDKVKISSSHRIATLLGAKSPRLSVSNTANPGGFTEYTVPQAWARFMFHVNVLQTCATGISRSREKGVSEKEEGMVEKGGVKQLRGDIKLGSEKGKGVGVCSWGIELVNKCWKKEAFGDAQSSSILAFTSHGIGLTKGPYIFSKTVSTKWTSVHQIDA